MIFPVEVKTWKPVTQFLQVFRQQQNKLVFKMPGGSMDCRSYRVHVANLSESCT